MAKKTEAAAPKSVGQKIAEAVSEGAEKLLHSLDHSAPPPEETPEALKKNEAESVDVESMSQHPKFDKFK